MSNTGNNLTLGEAARHFLVSLSAEEAGERQQEVNRFVRWYGRECPLAGLTAPEVANYAERLSLSDTDYARKLELIRTFLVYAKKQGWIKTNLAAHLKTRKGKTRLPSPTERVSPNTTYLTKEGYAELKKEIATLKGKRSQAIEEMRKAAADKDFRENAPLEAAKEQRGHLEGRIKELEETLKSAVVIGEKQNVTTRASLGDSVILRDLISGDEMSYTIVSPTEVDPTKGRISSVSPIGKVVMGKAENDVVEATVPAGKLRYQIKQIKHS